MRLLNWEKALAGLVIAWLLLLHLLNFSSAGALWRDEANSVQQAQMRTWTQLWDSLQFDSFPALYPSILKIWCFSAWGSSDSGLRLLGLLIGLGVLACVWIVGRRVGGRLPLICLVLLAADPVFISEGDGIRPYGISILFLTLVFFTFAEYLKKPSAIGLASVSLASVLAVQSSYVNGLFVGVLTLCAAGVALRQGVRQDLWLYFLPGLAAAVSLLPYARTLRQAQGWASMLHSRIEWSAFFQGYIKTHSMSYVLVWTGFSLLTVGSLFGRGRARAVSLSRQPVAAYTLSAALALGAAQILFVEATGVPPFPRYFLPGALMLALALEVLLAQARPAIRMLAAVAALLVTAMPTWHWLTQRHTNVDGVSAILKSQAGPNDLVVISPWFLHPSFQRYYHGRAEWVTVPDLEHYPIIRYDLVKNAILQLGAGDRVMHRPEQVLAGGGSVWFVSQRAWTNLVRRDAPERPRTPPAASGADYVRFRSYWEREIEYRLCMCCRRTDVPLPVSDRVWEEEDLMLTRWERR